MNYAVICIDETGSMAGQEERVVTSMNEYVNSLPDDAHVTVFKFDSNHWTKFYDDYKTAWQKMEPANYSPGAMTPLYDAIGKTVRHAESLASDGDKVLVMVDTDGHENASKEHTVDSVNAVVDAKKTAGWEFLFMAGGINEAQAQQVGAIGQALGMTTNMASHARRSQNFQAARGQTHSYFNSRSPETSPDWGHDPKRPWEKAADKDTEPFFAAVSE